MTFATVLTVGGATLAIGLVETILESMGKEKYANLLKIIAVCVLGGMGFKLAFELLSEVSRLFL